MSAETISTIEVSTPCCAAHVGLAHPSFIRRGKPRPGDSWASWNLRCDDCGKWWRVGFEIRTSYKRAEHSNRFETRGRVVGSPFWTAL